MGLADAPDAQAQLNGFIDRIAAEKIPCSSFHYGSGYSSKGKRRYVFTWNESKFPDPKTLNAKFKQAGMHLVANIKPCLLDDHPAYSSVKSQKGFIHDAGTGKPIVEQFWDGVGSHLDRLANAEMAGREARGGHRG
jgi:alpha-glucosidase